jgi:hypothetical protein
LINKTFKQLNAERAARRAEYEECQDLNNPGWREIHKYNKKKQKKNKAASSQAGGPAHKKPGFKQVDKSTSSGL